MIDEFKEEFLYWRLANTFICLISKSDREHNIGDYRPISFLGSIHKIITKVLMGRLKKVLVVIPILEFVEGKQIPDHGFLGGRWI